MIAHRGAVWTVLAAFACARAAAAPTDQTLPWELSPAPRVRAASPEPIVPVPPASTPEAPPRREIPSWKEETPNRPFLVLRTWYWDTSGSVNTRWNVQVPPSLVTPPGSEVFLGETQNYGGSGAMLVYSAEVAPLSWLSFEFQYGDDRPKGTYQDHYWVHAPDVSLLTYVPTGSTWNNPNHEDDLVYNSDDSSYRDWASASMYIRLLDGRIESLSHSIDFALGAERFRQNTHMKNLAVVSNENKYYAPGLPLGPVPGFDSNYNAYWQGPHVGFRETLDAPDGFSVQGLVLWSPVMEYYGAGTFNMLIPPTSRASPPNVADWAHGTAIHFAFTLGWSPLSFLRLEAGYQRLYFYSRTGLRRYYNADGTATDYQLDYATTELGGAFAGASLRF